MSTEIKVISQEDVYQDQWITLRRELVQINGEEKRFSLVKRDNAVVIIPIDQHGNTVLQKQLRVTPRLTLWEFPMGGVDQDQAPEQAAAMELEEETGLKVEQLHKIGGFYPVPGLMDQWVDVFVAEVADLSIDKLAPRHKGEGIDSYNVLPVDSVLDMIAHGEIVEGFTLNAYMIFIALEQHQHDH